VCRGPLEAIELALEDALAEVLRAGRANEIVIGWSKFETRPSTRKVALKIHESGAHLEREILES
jgi:hypothetical protein